MASKKDESTKAWFQQRAANRKKKRILGLLSIAVIILLGSVSPRLFDLTKLYLKNPESVIRDGMLYLLGEQPLKADVHFLLGQVGLMHKDEKLIEKIQQADIVLGNPQWMAERTVLLSFDERMLPWNTQGKLPEVTLANSMAPLIPMKRDEFDWLFELVTVALLCEQIKPMEVAQAIRKARIASHSYVLAHQLFAIQVMMQKKCIQGDIPETIRYRLANAIALETGPSELKTDLEFERLAMLAFAGYGPTLRKDFIYRLIDAQNKNGSWGEVEEIQNHGWIQTLSREHATALALYALAAMYYHN